MVNTIDDRQIAALELLLAVEAHVVEADPLVARVVEGIRDEVMIRRLDNGVVDIAGQAWSLEDELRRRYACAHRGARIEKRRPSTDRGPEGQVLPSAFQPCAFSLFFSYAAASKTAEHENGDES